MLGSQSLARVKWLSGRLVLNRELLVDELKRFEAGEELARTKMYWWRNHLDEVRALLSTSQDEKAS